MKSFATAILTLAAFCCAAPALAQDGLYYVGVNYAGATYKQEGVPNVHPSALAFKAGRELHRNLAVEVRAGFGVGHDTVTYLGMPVDFRLDHFFGFYGRGVLPLSEYSSVYGLIGLVGGRVTARGAGTSASSSDTGVSLGLGFELGINRHSAVNFEWAELFEGTDYKIEAASLGYTYRY